MVSGGCINATARLDTNRGAYFIKWNDKQAYPGMFEAEQQGLQMLREADALRIPEVLGTGEVGDQSFLVMEYIREGAPGHDFFSRFGQGLARLHQFSHTSFGLDHDNYMGSLPQYNHPSPDWATFFRDQRILPQWQMARNKGFFTGREEQNLHRLLSRLGQWLPDEPPALVHGDLWSGNYLTDAFGAPVLIDPAVYFGHREVEFGIMQLFGGYPPQFYHAYQEVWPFAEGWKERIRLYQLYPLLVHVNLFGAGYVGQVTEILHAF